MRRERELGYGERCDCEKCGRSWDTSRIPREQYEMVAALAIFFTLGGNIFSVFHLLPVALTSWSCSCGRCGESGIGRR